MTVFSVNMNGSSVVLHTSVLPVYFLQAPFIGPTSNGLVTPKFNGLIGKPACKNSPAPSKVSNDVGIPVSRQMLSPIRSPQTSTGSVSVATDLPQKHKKISFGITTPKPFQPVHNQMQHPAKQDSADNGSSTMSPRIVMQIKNGKVTTIEKSPDGKSQVVKGSLKKASTLVPYDDDSESGGEGPAKDLDKKPGERGPRVALDFSEQEKENRVGEKVSQGAVNAFSSSSASSPKKGESHVEGLLQKTSAPTAVKPGGLDWDLTLKLNRESGSSLKKMSIDTQSPTRINSTSTSWFVQAKDSAPSPSLASCSSNNSNHSVNSTTEWSVEPDSKASSSVDKKPQTPSSGWKVTDTPFKGERGLLVRSESLEDTPKRAKDLKRSSSLEPVLSQLKLNGHQSVDGFSKRTSLKTNGDSVGARADFSRHLGMNNSVPNLNGSCSVKDGSCSVKDSTQLDFAPCSKVSDEENAQQNGHEGHSDKQPLLASEDLPSAERVHKKHKKKKHKRDKSSERSKVKYTELEESMTSEDGQSRHKHKKKKHKRSRDHSDSDRKEKKRREHDDSDSDHKKKRHNNCQDSDYEGVSSRKRKKSESSDSEYTWEERTKETLQKEKCEKALQSSSDKSGEYCGTNYLFPHSIILMLFIGWPVL